MATLQRLQSDFGTPASRLIAEVHEMSREELVAAFEEARTSTPAEIVERQKRDRRERAERAAARLAASA